MKKFLIALLALIIAMFCVGCGTYTPASNRPGSGDSSGGGTGVKPGGDDDKPGGNDDDELTFTVRMTYGGRPYVPTTIVYALWNGADGSAYRAEFSRETGVAEQKGLDGVYTVSILNLPSGYTYNPNIYSADNGHTDTTVEIFRYNQIDNAGATRDLDPNKAQTVTVGELYRVELSSSSAHVWFLMSGCSLETWCDVVENSVTPRIVGYMANTMSGFVNPSGVQISGGGLSASYTKNIKFSSDEADYAAKSLNLFSISAVQQLGKYPVYVYFKIDKSQVEGGTRPPTPTYNYEARDAEETELLQLIQPEGTFKYVWEDEPDHLLVGDKYKLFEKGTTDKEGNEGDGYYHRYDAEEDIYYETIFVIISHCNANIPEDGDPPRDVGGFLYGLVSKDLVDRHTSGGVDYYGYDYTRMIETYARYCNTEGAHPLTEELKQFMMGYALREKFFDDGNGWAETNEFQLNSNEEDQWLFNCGYYVA